MGYREQELLLKYLKNDNQSVKYTFQPLERSLLKVIFHQDETKFVEYNSIEKMIYRNKSNDRVIPIESTTLSELNMITGNNVEDVKLHYGPNSDEFVRSMHANAITIGNAIYFRTKSYKPETEEGRELLLHELTHVQQNKEDYLSGQVNKDDLEKEAESAELKGKYNPDPERFFELNGKKYFVSEKLYKQILDEIRVKVEKGVEDKETILSDEDYIKFIIAYDNMEKRGDLPWQQ